MIRQPTELELHKPFVVVNYGMRTTDESLKKAINRSKRSNFNKLIEEAGVNEGSLAYHTIRNRLKCSLTLHSNKPLLNRYSPNWRYSIILVETYNYKLIIKK